MSIQAQLNIELIGLFPRIKEILAKSDIFEKSQILDYMIRYAMNSKTPLPQLGLTKLIEIENELIEIFKSKNWIIKQ